MFYHIRPEFRPALDPNDHRTQRVICSRLSTVDVVFAAFSVHTRPHKKRRGPGHHTHLVHVLGPVTTTRYLVRPLLHSGETIGQGLPLRSSKMLKATALPRSALLDNMNNQMRANESRSGSTPATERHSVSLPQPTLPTTTLPSYSLICSLSRLSGLLVALVAI